MKPLNLCLFLSLLRGVATHTVFTTLFVNDVGQGDGTCVRMNMTPQNSTFPVNDLSSNDMACGFDGTVGVARVCPVSQGSKLTFLWREWADASHPGSIDASHKGPCAVYMKAVDSAITDVGYGAGWFKIWDSGYDTTTLQWCTEKLIQNNGFLSVNIPDDLSGGYYLVRPELLSLQQADKSPPNPQFYVGCAQIFLQSNWTAIPEGTVNIPGYVSAGDASVDFNIYTPKWPYPMPGPAPYEGDSSKAVSSIAVTSLPDQTQTEGLVPDGCILSNANWCGIELDAYTTETGCWNASAACFDQDKLCYSSSPPTGSKNCPLWEAKCGSIQAACNAGNFNGPPNYGKNLNPTSTTSYSIPPAAAQTSGVSSAADNKYISSTSTILSLIWPAYIPKPTGPVSLVTDTLITDTYIPIATESTPIVTESAPMAPESTSLPTSVTTDMTSGSTSIVILTTLATMPFTILQISSSTTANSKTSASSSTSLVSIDATCGSISNQTCLGSDFGPCCSQWNWCGITNAYCGQGCQVNYGRCGKPLAEGKIRSYRRMYI